MCSRQSVGVGEERLRINVQRSVLENGAYRFSQDEAYDRWHKSELSFYVFKCSWAPESLLANCIGLGVYECNEPYQRHAIFPLKQAVPAGWSKVFAFQAMTLQNGPDTSTYHVIRCADMSVLRYAICKSSHIPEGWIPEIAFYGCDVLEMISNALLNRDNASRAAWISDPSVPFFPWFHHLNPPEMLHIFSALLAKEETERGQSVLPPYMKNILEHIFFQCNVTCENLTQSHQSIDEIKRQYNWKVKLGFRLACLPPAFESTDLCFERYEPKAQQSEDAPVSNIFYKKMTLRSSVTSGQVHKLVVTFDANSVNQLPQQKGAGVFLIRDTAVGDESWLHSFGSEQRITRTVTSSFVPSAPQIVTERSIFLGALDAVTTSMQVDWPNADVQDWPTSHFCICVVLMGVDVLEQLRMQKEPSSALAALCSHSDHDPSHCTRSESAKLQKSAMSVKLCSVPVFECNSCHQTFDMNFAVRWHCTKCADFDLCAGCRKGFAHHHNDWVEFSPSEMLNDAAEAESTETSSSKSREVTVCRGEVRTWKLASSDKISEIVKRAGNNWKSNPANLQLTTMDNVEIDEDSNVGSLHALPSGSAILMLQESKKRRHDGSSSSNTNTNTNFNNRNQRQNRNNNNSNAAAASGDCEDCGEDATNMDVDSSGSHYHNKKGRGGSGGGGGEYQQSHRGGRNDRGGGGRGGGRGGRGGRGGGYQHHQRGGRGGASASGHYQH